MPPVKKGAPCRLSAKQRGQLAHGIASTAPSDHGLEGGTWGYEAVRVHIKKRFGVKYTYNGTHRLLQRMGVRLHGIRRGPAAWAGRKRSGAARSAQCGRTASAGKRLVCNA